MSFQTILNKAYEGFVFNLKAKPIELVHLLKNKNLFSSPSYYPEKKQSPIWKNFIFQVGQVIKHGRPEKYYFMYGFDVKTKTERSEYIDYLTFKKRRDVLNYKNNAHNSTCVLRNKLYFDVFARSIGVPTPSIEACYFKNQLHLLGNGFRAITFDEYSQMGNRTLFCKETAGECGAGVFKLKIDDGKFYIKDKGVTAGEVEEMMHNSEYLFQKLVEQHPEMNKMYPGSINTIRLVTVRGLKDGKYHVMPSMLRIGANGSFVDNTSQGGLAVGFDLGSGQLHEFGFYKPEFGTKTDHHPNSNIMFADFKIPFIQEAEELAIRYHSMLKDIHSIGWDISIGPDGPIFIEGNDNWEINGPQVSNHGLKKEFLEYFFK